MFYRPETEDHGLARAPFKSCVVPRPIGWLSTVDENGVANLAPYSQFTNLTFDPPMVLVSINQGPGNTRKDTTVNIERTGGFVYNMCTYDLREQMNTTAAGFPPDVDEFEAAGLEKAPSVMVKAPRVAASPVQLECVHVQTIRIPGDSELSSCDVVIGRVVGVHVADKFILPDGKLDVARMRPLARMGYSDYTYVDKVFEISPSLAANPVGNPAGGLEGDKRLI